MTKEEKINKIYEVIADKTLSFWCKIILKNYLWEQIVNHSVWNLTYLFWFQFPFINNHKDKEKIEVEKVLWHIIFIWNILDWIEKNITETNPCPICWDKDIQLENFDSWLSWMQSEFSRWYCWNENCYWTSSDNIEWSAENIKYCCLDDLVFWNWLGNWWLWKEKRKPIEYQSDECIDYIYNLIIENENNRNWNIWLTI